jgi:hypothetical protein
MRRPEEQRMRHGKPRRCRHLAEAGLASQGGQRGATHQPQQHAEIGDHAAAEALDGHDQHNRRQAQSEVTKLPKSAAEGSPPPSHPPATGSSDRPITVITEPITTGGKSAASG